MFRKAILIAGFKEGDVTESNTNDVKFLSFFLQSTHGGSWKEEEIIKLINPSVAQLLFVFNRTTETERFIFYSGHGCMCRNNQYILIENSLISISNLLSKVPFEIAIFNCCRQYNSFKDLADKHRFNEHSFNFEDRYTKISNVPLHLNMTNFLVFTTRAGSPSRKLETHSCFVCLLMTLIAKINNMGYAKILPLKSLLAMASLAFKRSKPSQDLEYYVRN